MWAESRFERRAASICIRKRSCDKAFHGNIADSSIATMAIATTPIQLTDRRRAFLPVLKDGVSCASWDDKETQNGQLVEITGLIPHQQRSNTSSGKAFPILEGGTEIAI